MRVRMSLFRGESEEVSVITANEFGYHVQPCTIYTYVHTLTRRIITT